MLMNPKSALTDKLEFLSRLCGRQSPMTCQYNLLLELQSLLPWEQAILMQDSEPWILPLNERIPFSIPEQHSPSGIWQYDQNPCDRTSISVQYQPSQVWSDWCNDISQHYKLKNWVLMMIDVSLEGSQDAQFQMPILLLRNHDSFNTSEIGTLRIIHDALQQIVDQSVIIDNLINQSKDDPENLTIADDVQKDSETYDRLSFIDIAPEPCIQKCLQKLGLTPRQVQVMHLIIKGKELIEIAKDLGCTEATVRKHVENLYRRLGVQSRTAAIAQVLETIGIV